MVGAAVGFIIADRFSRSQGSSSPPASFSSLTSLVTRRRQRRRVSSCTTRRKRNTRKERIPRGCGSLTFAASLPVRADSLVPAESYPPPSVSVRQSGHLIWQRARSGDTDRSRQLIKRFPAYCRGLLGYAPWATLFSVASTYVRHLLPSLSLYLARLSLYRGPAQLLSISPSPSLATLRASVPHDRHDVPGVPRKGTRRAHTEARPRFEQTRINWPAVESWH